jgi:integrase
VRRPKLTNTLVERFACREGRKNDVLWDGELKGFGMRLSAQSGTRTYFFQYRVKGSKQERAINIGRHNDPYRVDQARAKALELKAQMLGGVDPVAEAERKEAERIERVRLTAAHSTTLRQVMEHFLTHRRTKHGPLRPATKQSIREMVEGNLSDWLDAPVATTITRDACLAKFTELSANAPSASNLTMVYLRALMNHCREMHATDAGDYPVMAHNPVTKMLRLRKLNPEKPRTGRVPLDRVGHVWSVLQQRRMNARDVDDRTAADLVCLRMLTGMRATESGSLRWSQINFGARTITLLADVSKNHNEMLIPMSTVLHDLLLERKRAPEVDPKVARRRRNQRATEYLFASCGKKTPWMTDARATMEAVSAAAGCHITPHDFRRTLEDIAKAVRVDPDERRQLLNHLADGVHQAAYSNNPDPEVLRPAVEAIAKYVTDAAAVAEAQQRGENVVPLRRA